jgi:arginyl-tRNA synthetase
MTVEESNEAARIIGIVALKTRDLVNHRLRDYIFDMGFPANRKGKTGQYLLCSAARIQSLLAGKGPCEKVMPPSTLTEANLALAILSLAVHFPPITRKAPCARREKLLAELADAHQQSLAHVFGIYLE